MGFIQRKGVVIGVDPDIERSGLAVITLSSRTLEAEALPFPELLDRIRALYAAMEPEERFIVVVEAGWMNKGNWHVSESRNGKFSPSAYAAAVGAHTGEGNAVSKLILQCLEHEGIPAKAQCPLRKCWRGKDGKITHAELAREAETYRLNFKCGRTNQEARDAALIAIVNM